MKNKSKSLPVFDPLHTDFAANPYDAYAALRQEGPYYYKPLDMWLLSRYEDVSKVSVHPNMVRSLKGAVPEHRYQDIQRQMKFDDMPFHERLVQSNLLDMDGCEHQTLRRIIFGNFTKTAISLYENHIKALADSYINLIPNGAEFDFVDLISSRYPGSVIGSFIGLPQDDIRMLGQWSDDIVHYYDLHKSVEGKNAAEEAAQNFYYYFRSQTQSSTEPAPHSLLAILRKEVETSVLTEDTFISLCMLIFMAGWGSTGDVMGNGLHQLLTHKIALQDLKNDVTLMPSAIQEVLRYDTPLPFFHRHALEDITIGGQDFKSGTTFGLLYAAANHDPKAFQAPDIFDIHRRPNRHLSFGHGAHLCLGNQLARLSLETFFTRLLGSFQNFELMQTDVTYKAGLSARGPKALYVKVAR